MELEFANPWLILLSPLALIPLFRSTREATAYSSIAMLPSDWISSAIFTLIRLTATMVILSALLGLAEPFYKQRTIERIGTGAHIILLLDRSASMNENFTGRYFGGKPKETKVAIARQVLTDFVNRRQEDFFAMISFSTAPIHILPLTQDKTAILAAINATHSRGRGVTNIAPGLSIALDYFTGQPITGSRVILLVSDGAARIDLDQQNTLKQLFRQNKSMLYWVYLRDKKSPSLTVKPKNANETTTPEYFLHQFFLSMDVPYQAFEAENEEALQQAIVAIEKQENKPIKYQERIPRQSLAKQCYLSAIIGLLFLLVIRGLEISSDI